MVRNTSTNRVHDISMAKKPSIKIAYNSESQYNGFELDESELRKLRVRNIDRLLPMLQKYLKEVNSIKRIRNWQDRILERVLWLSCIFLIGISVIFSKIMGVGLACSAGCLTVSYLMVGIKLHWLGEAKKEIDDHLERTDFGSVGVEVGHYYGAYGVLCYLLVPVLRPVVEIELVFENVSAILIFSTFQFFPSFLTFS